MEKFPVIQAAHITVSISNRNILNELTFTVFDKEQWVINGPSGAGKTTLLHVLAGLHSFRGKLTRSTRGKETATVVFVEQQHHFKNLSNVNNFYYQQRYNSADAEDAITVYEDLQNHVSNKDAGLPEVEEVVDRFHLKGLLDERLIQLSNGENKRLQLAKALLDKPDILLLDNPFVGLDTDGRAMLEKLLTGIAAKGIHIIMVTNPRYIPPFVTHVLSLMQDGSYTVTPANSFIKETADKDRHFSVSDENLFNELVAPADPAAFQYAVKMKQVNISYHDRKILDGINWQIRNGERWSLSGPNGAGKSTLLSLITADNPQAYANDIILFDRKRGSGETIWEIKRKIGYISPELHLHFDQSNNSFEVVASGLFDTIGLFRQPDDEQVELVNKWMKLLRLEKLRSKMLFQLSNSEQRMVLLARALVKNPPMLVLDEPCQGLDEQQVEAFKALISQVCIKGNKTLIYVSHYVEEIPDCVDRFMRIENGREKKI